MEEYTLKNYKKYLGYTNLGGIYFQIKNKNTKSENKKYLTKIILDYYKKHKIIFIQKHFILNGFYKFKITNDYTFLYYNNHEYKFKNDIQYNIFTINPDYEYKLYLSDKLNFNKINLNKIQNVSTLLQKLEYSTNQLWKDYFKDKKFKNQFSDNTVECLYHATNPLNLELILRSDCKLKSQRFKNWAPNGIYTTIGTSQCPEWIFSKRLVFKLDRKILNKYGYYINVDMNRSFGFLKDDSLIKNNEYSAVEKFTKEIMCNNKERELDETIIIADEIDLRKYCLEIQIYDKKIYDELMKMDDICMKDKIKFNK